MKKTMLFGFWTTLLFILSAGCASHSFSIVPNPAPAASLTWAAPSGITRTVAPVATLTPAQNPTLFPANPTAAPEGETFAIDGAKLYRKDKDSQTVIYDASGQFPQGWSCRLELLVVEDDALYFTEGGAPPDADQDYDSIYDVARTDRDGGDRRVLHSQNAVGYTQMLSYGNRLFFVSDGFDSQDIGWAYKDGKAANWLDISDYAAQNGVEQDYNSAKIYIKNGALYADILFYTDKDPQVVWHTVSIGDDLDIQRID